MERVGEVEYPERDELELVGLFQLLAIDLLCHNCLPENCRTCRKDPAKSTAL